MRARVLALCLLTLAAPALAQNKQVGTIGIWSNNPTPNSLTDSGNARAPADFTVTGNLNVIGNITGNLPTAPTTPPFVGTFDAAVTDNSTLKAQCETGSACISNRTTIFRAGYGTPGDGGAGFFRWVNATCASLADGANADEGMRIAQFNGNSCFVLIPYQGLVPVEVWGVSPAGNAAGTNATRVVAALNESSRSGVAVFLSQLYPMTAAAVSAACPSLIGAGPRVGFVYNTVVTTGLSITCTLPTPRNQLLPPSMIRLSNFGMWTTQQAGGLALALEINYGSNHPAGPNWISVFVDHLFISGDNTCGSTTTPLDCMGTGLVKPHYWSAGISGTNLPNARFTNNIMYGSTEPFVPSGGVPPTIYPMEFGIKLTGRVQNNCDTPVFSQNSINGTHYAIYNKAPTSGARSCEGWRIENNLLHRNDYNVYMDASSVTYEPPGVFIIGNEMESQLESIYLYKMAKIFISNNTMDIGNGYNSTMDTANCMYIFRSTNFKINNNHCTNIGAKGMSNDYGGPGSTGILVDGTPSGCGGGQPCRSQYGMISDNTCEFFEGCIRLTANTREIYSENNYVGNPTTLRPDLAPTTPPSNSGRYIYKDESGGLNFLSVRCGPGQNYNAQGAAAFRAGLRTAACMGGVGSPWPATGNNTYP